MSKIVLEDFNEGDGYYKVNLAYLSKEQVEEIESLVSKWNPTDEDFINCIGMCLTDVNEQRFKDYCTNLKDCLDWLEKQGTKRKQLYVRFGDIPSNEKSKIYRGEEEIGDENGVSVYPAFELNGNIVLGLTLPITKTTLYTQQHLLEYDNRPCYLVSGDYVGDGTDGEPLIRNISIIKRLYNYRIKEIEKQAEQNLVNKIIPKFKIGDTITYIGECKELITDNKYTIKEISKNCYISTCGNKIPFSMQEYYIIINDPKFKVGDWITNSIETVQITGYDIDYGYQVDYKGSLQHRDTDIIEKEYHLWTIQDAKDGDILCEGDNVDGDTIFIFKNYLDDESIITYCDYDKGELNDSCNLFCYNVMPATKEQCDLLFVKIKETGYEWDPKRKELKKIEQKQVDSYCQDNCKGFQETGKCFADGPCSAKIKGVSKFSEGDWIVKKGHVYGGVPVMIKEMGNYLYLCERQDGVIIELNKNDILKEYKHWDITDAVDGNVLIYNKTKSPFIYNGKIKNYDTGNPKDIFIGAHCGIYGKGEFIINHVEYWTDNDVQPATKEQCDLLFQKMRKAGYEWDWWKKELKNIKQTSTDTDKVEHKFKVGDKIIDEKGETYEVIEVDSFYYTIKDHDNNEWAVSFDKEENQYQLLNKDNVRHEDKVYKKQEELFKHYKEK